MFGTILVFVVAVALVATYILIVNRMLRSDEHWNEERQPLVAASRPRPVAVAPQNSRSGFTPNHA